MMNRLSDYNKNTILNYLFKGIGAILSYLLIRVCVDYLGKDIYGSWTAIITIMSWINICDLGIGNGVRNQVSKYLAEGNKKDISEIVNCILAIMIKISFVIFTLGFIILGIMIRLKKIDLQFGIAVAISLIMACFNFSLSIFRSVAYGVQKSARVSLVQVLTTLFAITGILVIDNFADANLIIFAFVDGMAGVLANFYLVFYLRKNKFYQFKICWKNKHWDKYEDTFCAGVQFFILQIYNILIFSTDTIIIKIMVGNVAVTDYSMIKKIYDAGNELFSVMLIALWSGVAFHYARNDKNWIRNKIHDIGKLLLPFSMGVLLVSIFLNFIVRIWLGNTACEYDMVTILIFALDCIVTAWSGIYANVANGMGKLKIQLIMGGVSSLLNIPFSIISIKVLHWGYKGVRFASAVCVLLMAFGVYLSVKRELNSD